MIAVDHFQIVLLVALICISGIGPAQGLHCVTNGGTDSNGGLECSPEEVCAIGQKDLKLLGCSAGNTCSTIGENLVCDPDGPYCCCSGTDCLTSVKDACTVAALKDTPQCAPYQPTEAPVKVEGSTPRSQAEVAETSGAFSTFPPSTEMMFMVMSAVVISLRRDAACS